MGKKKQALFDTNWKSRAKAAEAQVDALRKQLAAKSIKATLIIRDHDGVTEAESYLPVGDIRVEVTHTKDTIEYLVVPDRSTDG